MGSALGEEGLRPCFIRLARHRRVVQAPSRAAVGNRIVSFCALNQAVDHSAEPGAGRRVARAHSSGPSQRALGCARHGCCSVPACRPPDSATDTATAPADSEALSPGRVRAPLWHWPHLPTPTERPKPVSSVPAAFRTVPPASALPMPAPV